MRRNTDKINENASNIEKIAITETYSVGDTVKEMYRALVRYKVDGKDNYKIGFAKWLGGVK